MCFHGSRLPPSKAWGKGVSPQTPLPSPCIFLCCLPLPGVPGKADSLLEAEGCRSQVVGAEKDSSSERQTPVQSGLPRPFTIYCVQATDFLPCHLGLSANYGDIPMSRVRDKVPDAGNDVPRRFLLHRV